MKNQLKAIIAHKYFWNSYVAGMKTKSEFDDEYLNFIRKGIPSALRRDNAES
jgi:hypothetical protein